MVHRSRGPRPLQASEVPLPHKPRPLRPTHFAYAFFQRGKGGFIFFCFGAGFVGGFCFLRGRIWSKRHMAIGPPQLCLYGLTDPKVLAGFTPEGDPGCRSPGLAAGAGIQGWFRDCSWVTSAGLALGLCPHPRPRACGRWGQGVDSPPRPPSSVIPVGNHSVGSGVCRTLASGGGVSNPGFHTKWMVL